VVAHGVPGDLLQQCVELGLVLVAHVLHRLEGIGHRQAQTGGAAAVDGGKVAVAGEDLQRGQPVATLCPTVIGGSSSCPSRNDDSRLMVAMRKQVFIEVWRVERRWGGSPARNDEILPSLVFRFQPMKVERLGVEKFPEPINFRL